MSTALALNASPAKAASLKQVGLSRMAGIGHALWRAMEAFGQRRAAAEMLRTADWIGASRPELAQALRRIAAAPTGHALNR